MVLQIITMPRITQKAIGVLLISIDCGPCPNKMTSKIHIK